MTGPGGLRTPVGERFDARVEGQPAAPALVLPDRTVTYAELRSSVWAIAEAVGQAADHTDGPAAILATRPELAIPAILGCLTAGVTYTVVDPSYPRDRVEFMLSHSAARVVLADPDAARSPDLAARHVIPLGDLERRTAPAGPPAGGPAYILYTSGSTGAPKGVVHVQENIINKADVVRDALAIRPTDRMSLLFSPTSGASTSDIFGALLNGAAVAPFELTTRGLPELVEWLTTTGITVIHTLPTVFRRFLQISDPARQFSQVRCVLLTGESVLQSDLSLFRMHFRPGTKLVHRLSSTETGGMTSLTIDHETEVTDEILPVGYALPGRTIRILDEAGTEVPVGQKGEISVESPFLAVGYWRDEDLTAKAFLPSANGGRMFRTGDIGRARPDGCIEFLGRRAGRLKIAGHTIETREVERALQEIAGFQELAVVGREVVPGNPEMAAFYVPADGAPSWNPAMREALAARVPAHLIPSRFVELGTLPLTPLGKIDRDALPWPNARERSTAGASAPRTQTERLVAETWSSVFGLTSVGIDESFFDLGGTSIEAFSVFALLARRTGVDLPPTTIATAPTVAQIATLIDQHVASDDRHHLVALRTGEAEPPVFCLHGGEGYTLGFRKVAEYLDPGRPVFGLDALALDGRGTPHRSVEDVAAAYLREIRAVQPTGPYHLVGYSFGGTVAFEIAHQLQREGQTLGLLCQLDAVRSTKSLFRSRLRQRGRFLRSIWLGIRRAARRAKGDTVDVAARSAGTLANQVPIRLLVDLVPRPVLRRWCDARLRKQKPIPHALRQPYYFDLHSEAASRYRFEQLDGDLAIIAARDQSAARDAEWRPYINGELLVIEVDCEHMEMFLEPYVAEVGGRLQQLLNSS